MDPQQELFTQLRTMLKAKGYDVYDSGLPPEGVPYPFIYLGESTQDDDANKTAVFGRVSQRIHVWHNDPERRGSLSQILANCKMSCRALGRTKNFKWSVESVSQNILADDTTSEPLLHGILDVTFRFS